MIGWKDYPKPNLRFIRNVWVVEVSIPTSIRHLFGIGSGATNNKRKAFGNYNNRLITSDYIKKILHSQKKSMKSIVLNEHIITELDKVFER